MAKLPYLYDDKFLLEMDNLRLRHQYAKITVLDFMTEKTIEDITGRVTSGSISLNGDSCVRRTANLTFVIDDPEYFNLAGGNKYNIRNGRDKRCPKCKIEQNKKARQQYSKETKLYKILQERWLGAKDRAFNKGIPFTITKEDLLELWE